MRCPPLSRCSALDSSCESRPRSDYCAKTEPKTKLKASETVAEELVAAKWAKQQQQQQQQQQHQGSPVRCFASLVAPLGGWPEAA